MRQVMFSNSKAFVARMPRPTPGLGCVLVRTEFSLISSGTELAALRPLFAASAGQSAAERVSEVTTRAQHYLGKAMKNPRLAIDRAMSIARNSINRRLADVVPKPVHASVHIGPVEWTQQVASVCEVKDWRAHGRFRRGARPLPGRPRRPCRCRRTISSKCVSRARYSRAVSRSAYSTRISPPGSACCLSAKRSSIEKFHFDPGRARTVTLMLSNGSTSGENRMVLTEATVTMVPAESAGLPVTEMIDQGWNVGYSLAGTVVASRRGGH